ncbi:MAG: pirin family protein [Bacteroidetes bacterium]|nr:MAG: pirin family protein [Bacteroidota bacterium]
MTSSLKPLLQVFRGQPAQVGDGFMIRRALPNQGLGQLGPFLVLDYAGPTYFAPSGKARGVDQHPHRGFETVSIVYQGELEHRDSQGNKGSLGPGDVQWMTAASGVVHEEKHSQAFTQSGGTLEMIQLWVNLPAVHKMSAPGYQEITDAQIPALAVAEGRGSLRLIAGEYEGQKGPARTFTPISLFDLKLDAGATFRLRLPATYHTGLFVLHGEAVFQRDTVVTDAQLAVFDTEGAEVLIEAQTDTRILVLGGEPIAEPVMSYGPFVMNTQEEIRQAYADYRSGKMGRL